MNAEHLLDAMERIDDELILEAAGKPNRRKRPLWQVATAAAAAVVVCAGLYILPAMQPAGTAAPESGTTNGLFEDVADTAGIVTDGSRDEYKYMTDSSMSQTQESVTGRGEATPNQGVFEPVFCTEQGRYMLVGEELPIKSKLPDGVQYVGELAQTSYDKPVYPSVGTKELVGCSVWQSADGEFLYIQNPAGGWLQATRSK